MTKETAQVPQAANTCRNQTACACISDHKVLWWYELMAKEFQLDSVGTTLRAIAADPTGFIISASARAGGRRQQAFIRSAAGILFHRSTGNSAALKAQAFCSGAYTTLEAFEHTEMDARIHSRVKEEFARQATPLNLFDSHPDVRLHAFEAEEQRGALAHQEISHHLIHIDRYYTEIAQDASYGRYVKLGGWFTAHRLDVCYLNATSTDSHEVFPQDWDQALVQLMRNGDSQ